MSTSAESSVAGGGLTGPEAAELSHQIAGLTRAGLPLAPGLLALAEEMPRGRLRRSMLELAETLEAGVPLEQAIASHEAKIPPHLRGLVIAGIRSHCLGDLLSRYSEYASVGTELTRALWLSLAYPVLTAASALALFCLRLRGGRGPVRADLLRLRHPAPASDPWASHACAAVRSTWSILPLVALLGFTAWLAARLFLTRAKRRSLAGRLPLVGKVWRHDVARGVLSPAGLAPGERYSLARVAAAFGRGSRGRRFGRGVAGHGQLRGSGSTVFARHGKRAALSLGACAPGALGRESERA